MLIIHSNKKKEKEILNINKKKEKVIYIIVGYTTLLGSEYVQHPWNKYNLLPTK